jgi:hypothetical protein
MSAPTAAAEASASDRAAAARRWIGACWWPRTWCVLRDEIDASEKNPLASSVRDAFIVVLLVIVVI